RAIDTGRVVEGPEWTRGRSRRAEGDAGLQTAGAVVQVDGVPIRAEPDLVARIVADLKIRRRIRAKPQAEERGSLRRERGIGGFHENHRLAGRDAGDAVQRHGGSEEIRVVVDFPAGDVRSGGADV